MEGAICGNINVGERAVQLEVCNTATEMNIKQRSACSTRLRLVKMLQCTRVVLFDMNLSTDWTIENLAHSSCKARDPVLVKTSALDGAQA